MRGGDLFGKAEFDSPAHSSDGYGGAQDGWKHEFSCRAAFVYAGGGEAAQAARMEGRGVMKVRVRSASATRRITQDWRLRDARTGDVYNIREADSVTDRFWVYLVIERGVAV